MYLISLLNFFHISNFKQLIEVILWILHQSEIYFYFCHLKTFPFNPSSCLVYSRQLEEDTCLLLSVTEFHSLLIQLFDRMWPWGENSVSRVKVLGSYLSPLKKYLKAEKPIPHLLHHSPSRLCSGESPGLVFVCLLCGWKWLNCWHYLPAASQST